MVAGGNSSVGGGCTRFQWGTQQGRIQVDALSTSFEIQTQGIYCHSSVSSRFTALKRKEKKMHPGVKQVKENTMTCAGHCVISSTMTTISFFTSLHAAYSSLDLVMLPHLHT